jgi:hypothetical protein
MDRIWEALCLFFVTQNAYKSSIKLCLGVIVVVVPLTSSKSYSEKRKDLLTIVDLKSSGTNTLAILRVKVLRTPSSK